MMPIRFFTDDDIYGAVAVALRHAGFDAISTPEADRQGKSDESQLSWALMESRCIITFNVAHFVRLHTEWMQAGREHAGIIVSSQRSIGDLLARLIHLAKTLDGDAMRNRLEFASDW